MIVAIDGPAGAGKSTIAKLIAEKLRFLYVDTGAMYRALTLKVIENKIDIKDTQRIVETASDLKLGLVNNPDGSLKVSLDGRDVSRQIREPRVTKFVSDIAKLKGVRDIMLKLQRELAKRGNCVLDGRDIGTVVFPYAKNKFYLDAHFKERVKRRHRELSASGENVSAQDVGSDLKNRDSIDSTRETAPLKKAQDAIYIDTTNMTIEEVVNIVLKNINPNVKIQNPKSKF